jgi:hypothetical protein
MEEAAHPDWSGLLEDLLAMVMRSLDIIDLFHAGAVCTSWYAAYSAVRRVRIPIKDAAPCLLYSCADDDADTATLYSPSGGVAFKVRLLAPSFRSRHVVGSAHGWVVTADEASNLQALNPLTGAQVDLPPVTGFHHVEPCPEGRQSAMASPPTTSTRESSAPALPASTQLGSYVFSYTTVFSSRAALPPAPPASR